MGKKSKKSNNSPAAASTAASGQAKESSSSSVFKPLPLLPSRRDMIDQQCTATDNKTSRTSRISVEHLNNAILEAGKGLISSEQLTVNLSAANETSDSGSGVITTVKKGVLWQQQNFDRFHQKLFNRWKKRFFILTTDYLVCFGKSTSKVGHSEMGKFIYKTALTDVTSIEWLRPKKSDKGPIILHTKANFDLSLWSKQGLGDWMEVLRETCDLVSIRRPEPLTSDRLVPNQIILDNGHLSNGTGLYDNTQHLIAPITALDATQNLSSIKPGKNIDNNDENDNSLSRVQDKSHSKHSSSNRNTGDGRLAEIDAELGSQLGRPMGNLLQSSSPRELNMINETVLNKEHQRDECNDIPPSERPTKATSVAETTITPSGQQSLANETTGDGMSETKQLVVSDKITGQNVANSSRATARLDINNVSDDDKVPTKQNELNERQGEHKRQSDEISLTTTTTTGLNATKLEETRYAHQIESDKLKLNSNPNEEANKTRLESKTANSNASSHHSHQQMSPSNEGEECSVDNGLIRCAPEFAMSTDPQNNDRSNHNHQRRLKPARDPVNNVPSSQRLAHHLVLDLRERAQNYEEMMLERQRRINIESTVTPLRGPASLLRRQQSLQVARGPMSQFSWNRHQANSIDVPPTMNNISNGGSNNNNGQLFANITSYHHKLMQLQMLHNNGAQNDEYQIYGGNAPSTHYGYYSMRSNLKSAASEFSFIRPNSSAPQPAVSQQQQQHQQQRHQILGDKVHIATNNGNHMTPKSTLPHQFSSYMLSNRGTNTNNQQYPSGSFATPSRMSLVVPHGEDRILAVMGSSDYNNNNNNRGSGISEGFSNAGAAAGNIVASNKAAVSGGDAINFSFAEGAQNQGVTFEQGNQITLAELTAPTRELPLRPNKKRQPGGRDGDQSNQKRPTSSSSFSISSNIAGFFRRAFSKRSSKAKRSGGRSNRQLAESCSSSMCTFDEKCFPQVPLVQSAFSTGSKSITRNALGNGDSRRSRQQHEEILSDSSTKPQKMIDMIEAFANKTIIEQDYSGRHPNGLINGNHSSYDTFGPKQHSLSFHNEPLARMEIERQQRQHEYQRQLQQQALVEGPMQRRSLIANDSLVAGISGQKQCSSANVAMSPMNKSSSISSTLVAHSGYHNKSLEDRIFTIRDNVMAPPNSGRMNGPIVSQIETDSPLASRANRVMSANLTPLFARADLQSSITAAEVENADHFGLSPGGPSRASSRHPARPSSIYGQPSMISSSNTSSQLDRIGNFGAHRYSMHNGRPNNDFYRRPHTVRAPYLDTTREVSEEVSTPTIEDVQLSAHFASGLSIAQRRERDHNTAAAAAYQRQAIVNPMLHSSTMDTIYDNHPLIQRNNTTMVDANNSDRLASYHYDNQPIGGGSRGYAPAAIDTSGDYEHSIRMFERLTYQCHNDIANATDMHNLDGFVPPRPVSNRSAADRVYDSKGHARMAPVVMMHNKPAAVVAPRTPNHSMLVNCTPTRDHTNQHHQHYPLDGSQGFRNSTVTSTPTNSIRGNNGVGSNIRTANGIAPIGNPGSPIVLRQSLLNHSPMANSHIVRQQQQQQQNQQQQYSQYSPLVSRQTRLLKRNDGVQATIIGGGGVARRSSSSDYAQPLVDTSRCRGINPIEHNNQTAHPIDPVSIVDSSRRDSANLTYNDNSIAQLETKSLSLISRGSTLNDGGSNSGAPDSRISMLLDEEEIINNHEGQIRGDSLCGGRYTSTSKSANSSSERTLSTPSSSKSNGSRGPTTRAINYVSAANKSKANVSHRNKQRTGPGSRKQNGVSDREEGGGTSGSSNSSDNGRNNSSIEHSDELASHNGSLEEPDEKVWINSKLAQ